MQGTLNGVNVWHLFHSCFVVQTVSHCLVFDYFDHPGSHAISVDTLLQRMQDRKGIVFASHGHGDHFSPSVYEWKTQYENITYVISDDIDSGKHTSDTMVVSPGQKYQVGNVTIETLESTDIGVAFLVTCDGLTVYHAGDLNWWHWEGEPEEDNAAMANNYKQQIDLLRGRQIDIAFIPVDPRLEASYTLGLRYFMQAVGAEHVFPMHFGRDYPIYESLKKDLPEDWLRHIVSLHAQSYLLW